MAMGKRPAARQASPMWVDTAALPTSDGHPFFERLNRVLEDAGFDAFVEELCATFYADRLRRPSLRPGRDVHVAVERLTGRSIPTGGTWRNWTFGPKPEKAVPLLDDLLCCHEWGERSPRTACGLTI